MYGFGKEKLWILIFFFFELIFLLIDVFVRLGMGNVWKFEIFFVGRELWVEGYWVYF